MAEVEVAFQFHKDGVGLWLVAGEEGKSRMQLFFVKMNREQTKNPSKSFHQALTDSYNEAQTAANLLKRMKNLDDIEAALEREEGVCAQCGMPALDNDYLCQKCRAGAN